MWIAGSIKKIWPERLDMQLDINGATSSTALENYFWFKLLIKTRVHPGNREMKYFSLLSCLEWEKPMISLVILTREHSTLLNKMHLWNIWSNKKMVTRYLWCLLKELLCGLNEAMDKKTLDWDQQSLVLNYCYFYLAPECFGYSFCMSQTSTTPYSFTRLSLLDQSHWTIWLINGVINKASSSRLKFCKLKWGLQSTLHMWAD